MQDTFTANWNSIQGVFDEQTRRKPLVFAADVCGKSSNATLT